jgi:hypothetical protein
MHALCKLPVKQELILFYWFEQVYKGVVHEYGAMVTELCSGPCIALEIVAGSPNNEPVVQAFRELVGPADPVSLFHFLKIYLFFKFIILLDKKEIILLILLYFDFDLSKLSCEMLNLILLCPTVLVKLFGSSIHPFGYQVIK